jgi:hypothetical protein
MKIRRKCPARRTRQRRCRPRLAQAYQPNTLWQTQALATAIALRCFQYTARIERSSPMLVGCVAQVERGP